MPKRIDITDDLKAKVITNMGSEPTWEQIAVFEMTAVTSLPLNQAGSIYHNARITNETFQEAADFINQGGFVPFHTVHNSKGEVPVGRVFYGERLFNPAGYYELRVLAFIDLTAHADLANKIDNGIVEEVSIGMFFKELLCATCGDNLLNRDPTVWLKSRTCANGHFLGSGLHYLRPHGLGEFRELSAVSKGASTNAKILDSRRTLLVQDFNNPDLPLAANLKSPELMLFTYPTNLNAFACGEDPMLIAELQSKLSSVESNYLELQTILTAAEAKVLALEASATAQLAAAAETLAATQAQVAALEAAKSEAEAAKVTVEAALSTTQAQVVALEAAKSEAEAKVADLAVIQVKLTQFEAAETAKLSQRPFRIPLGGVAGLNAAHSDADKPKTTAVGASSAFKTPKRN